MPTLTRFGKPRRTPKVSIAAALAFEKRLADGKVYRSQNRMPTLTWYEVANRERRRPRNEQAPVECIGDPYLVPRRGEA